MDHVPHSIYIKPLRVYDAWPENPNNPISSASVTNKTKQINTYDDWKIVPLSRPIVAAPSFKETYVDLPGTYGSLDFSRAQLGLPTYGNRIGQWEFVVLNDFRSWETAYSDIMHTIHGKRCIVTLEDDKKHFYVGNLTLNEWRSDPGWSRIVISYNLEPFKYLYEPTKLSVDIAQYRTAYINLKSEIIGRGPVHPWIKLTAENLGTNEIDMYILYGNNELGSLQDISLKTADKYVEIPEFILSNESGSNDIGITFMLSQESEYQGPVHIDILYTRRYM